MPADELRIIDGSSDVCSSDLTARGAGYDADLIQAVKNELVDEIGGIKGQIVAVNAGTRSVQDQQSMAGTRIEQLLAEVSWTRDEVLAAFERITPQVGRASCRDRVCQSVSISVVGVSLKKKIV